MSLQYEAVKQEAQVVIKPIYLLLLFYSKSDNIRFHNIHLVQHLGDVDEEFAISFYNDRAEQPNSHQDYVNAAWSCWVLQKVNPMTGEVTAIKTKPYVRNDKRIVIKPTDKKNDQSNTNKQTIGSSWINVPIAQWTDNGTF